MRVLIDMNLSPRWVPVLRHDGHHAVHWSEAGAPAAPDTEIMAWARTEGYVVFTHDLDFTRLLAVTGADGPSVIQARTQDVLPATLGPSLLRTLRQFEHELGEGALISLTPSRSRVRLLPLRR